MATRIKRKKPPTFQYYPVNRGKNTKTLPCSFHYLNFRLEIAKKLKKAWVEKTKIKSKWKAQKKKESLAASSILDLPVYDEEERDNDAEKNGNSRTDYVRSLALPTEELPHSHVHVHLSRAHVHPELPVKRIPDVLPTKKRKISKEDSQPAEPPSLRELKREAYSQSTLHSFKSDPFKKRDQSRRGSGSRGRGKGFIERGRGQPNMKLRMNVMLEKIKQDVA